MPFTEAELAIMAARGSTLTERLGPDYEPDPAANPAAGQARWAYWCHVVADGDAERFARRLHWEDWHEVDWPPLLAGVRLKQGARLPEWVLTLQTLITAVEATSQEVISAPFCRPLAPLPFEALLAPFVLWAAHQVQTRAASHLTGLTPDAFAALQHSLLARLSQLTSPCLHMGYGHWHHDGPASPQERIKAFAKALLRDGLPAFLMAFPALARLLTAVVTHWIDATVEFLQRLADDRPTLQTTFAADIGLETVVSLEAGLSDPHYGGRTVHRLHFASGCELIYKPKPLAMEAAFAELVHWLNDHDEGRPFLPLQVLDRGEYGWVRAVAPAPCPPGPARERYFHRWGQLLCLLQALHGADANSDNVLTCGEYPVLIDVETLLDPPTLTPAPACDDAGYQAERWLQGTVWWTGMLPAWELSPDGQEVFDHSTLGAIDATGMIRRRHQPAQPVMAATGRPFAAIEHLDAILAGYQHRHACLQRDRASLLASGSPLSALLAQAPRYLFRPTRHYNELMAFLLQPQHVGDGVDFAIGLEAFAHPVLAQSPTKPPWWPVLSFERQHLQRGDVPAFHVDKAGTGLRGDGHESVPQVLPTSSREQVLTTLTQLGEADLAEAERVIRQTLVGRASTLTCAAQTRPITAPAPPAGITCERSIAVSRASTLCRRLRERVVRGRDGSVTWVGLRRVPGHDRLRFRPLGWDIADGLLGVALFLAACQRVAGEGGDLAEAALLPVQRGLAAPVGGLDDWLQEPHLGRPGGIGGLLIALAHSGVLLRDDSLLNAAVGLVGRLDDAVLTASQFPATVPGLGEAILGLLEVHAATGDSRSLAMALAGGRALVAQASPAYRRPGLDPTEQATLLLTLSRLQDACPDPLWGEAAAPLCDRLEQAGHLSNGHLLARIAATRTWQQSSEGLSSVLATVVADGPCTGDALCCGTFGRVDVLMTAAQALGREDWQQAALHLAAHAMAKPAFQPLADVPEFGECWGLHHGLAGIGYQLLRLVAPMAAIPPLVIGRS